MRIIRTDYAKAIDNAHYCNCENTLTDITVTESKQNLHCKQTTDNPTPRILCRKLRLLSERENSTLPNHLCHCAFSAYVL